MYPKRVYFEYIEVANNIRNTEEAVRGPQYSLTLLSIILTKAHRVVAKGCCGLSTASEVFLIVTTQLYQYFRVLFLFALFSDELEEILPKYSHKAILHAAHFRSVVNGMKIMTARGKLDNGNAREVPSRPWPVVISFVEQGAGIG